MSVTEAVSNSIYFCESLAFWKCSILTNQVLEKIKLLGV